MRRLIPIVVLIAGLGVTGSVSASELLTQAREDYDFQLDQYRESYAEFILKRSQFEQNSSFANQEALVAAAKALLASRSDVWWNYWQAVRIDLLETKGMEVAIQGELVGEIAGVQNGLRQHKGKILELETREPLSAEAKLLNIEYENYLALAFRSLKELKLARFGWSITQMQQFQRQLQEAVAIQIRNTNERQVKERGLGEVDSILSRLRERLEDARVELDVVRVNRFDKAYGDVMKELSPLYPDLIRAQELLDELSEGIVL